MDAGIQNRGGAFFSTNRRLSIPCMKVDPNGLDWNSQLCRAQWGLILNYLNMHTNELGSFVPTLGVRGYETHYHQKTVCGGQMPNSNEDGPGEEEYLRSNSRNSNNRKVQVFSSRFDPWANRLPTTNRVSGCLTATAARHPFSSHRSPCRPSQFAPCTLECSREAKSLCEKTTTTFQTRSILISHWLIITTPSVSYKPWNRACLPHIAKQLRLSRQSKHTVQRKWHGFCLTGGQKPNTFSTAIRIKKQKQIKDINTSKGHMSSDTKRWQSLHVATEGHMLPFSLRRTTLHSNRKVHIPISATT